MSYPGPQRWQYSKNRSAGYSTEDVINDVGSAPSVVSATELSIIRYLSYLEFPISSRPDINVGSCNDFTGVSHFYCGNRAQDT